MRRLVRSVAPALLALALVSGLIGLWTGQLGLLPSRALLSPEPRACPAYPDVSTQEEYHGDPPFVRIDELLGGTVHYSRQPAAGCPLEATGRLCRLEDVFDEIFLISLPRATERLARVRAQLRALGVPYTLVHAVDSRLLAGAGELAKIVLASATQQQPGVFALFLTHLSIMDYVARSPYLERVLILEDDVTFCADFPRAFDGRMRRIPGDWRMLWLGALVLTPTYKNAEALDHFVDVGFARPTRVSTAFALGLHREAAAFVFEELLASRDVLDERPFKQGLVNRAVLGSSIDHGWWDSPSAWAHDNGFDLANFDLVRGYHPGGELGSDLRCVIDEPAASDEADGADEAELDEAKKPNPQGFFVGQVEVVNSSAECCAKCSREFPWCRAWRWYTRTHRAPVPSAKRAVSGHMVQEDSVPRVPNVVHFFPRRTTAPASAAGRRLDVWSFLSVLSAAINTEPDHIRWWYNQGDDGGESLPEGPWWDECVRPLITSLHRHAPDTAILAEAQKEDSARLGVLIEEGGIMLDTDALVVRSFAPLRARQLVSLARDGLGRDELNRSQAGVGVVVAPSNASFLHRWLAKARDQSAEKDYRAGALVLQLAEQHPDEARLLSHAAFYPRSSSPQHLEVAYEADDCASEHESFSVYRHSSAVRASAPATGEESPADELERLWLGKGSLHRVARAIVRKALAGGRLCALAEKEVRRLEARSGAAPSCPPVN